VESPAPPPASPPVPRNTMPLLPLVPLLPTPPPPVTSPLPRKAMPTPSQIERAFAGHIKRNQMPSMNMVMSRMHLGKPRAKAVLAHLETVMAKPAQAPVPLPSQRELVLATA
jgi:hypothetical protein